jgi:hypothetical protein
MLTVGVVGCRLLYLARRGGERPELYLGLSLVLGGVFGAMLEGAGLAMATEGSPQIAGKLLLIGKLFGLGGVTFSGLFIWRVFRPEARWAPLLFCGVLSVSVLSMGGMALHGSYATAVLPRSWVLVEFVGRSVMPIWLVVEASLYYRAMKRRMRLGLADPIVTNRFALWAGAGVGGLVVLSTSLPPTFLDPVEHEIWLNLDLLFFSLAGFAASGFYWLTFFPPVRYREWLTKRAPAASAGS